MAFVISSGQIESLERPVTPSMPGSVRLADRRYESYETIWRSQPQVRTVVAFLARNIAQLGLHVFKRVSDADRKRLTDHPLADLIARPLPPQFKITRYRLINALMHDLGIYDNAYWLKMRPSPGGFGLVRLPPRAVVPIGDTWFAPEFYQYTGNKGRTKFSADQVVHFFGYNPNDPRHGVSPMESLRRILAEEFAAGQYREQMWRNGARMSGYLSRPGAASTWDKGAREQFRASWQSQYSGDGSRAGGTPILEEGLEFHEASFDSKQAQYIEARRLTREEVAAHYFIPPPMIGILDNATFSNITEQHKMLYQDTLGPWLEMIQEDIELQLLPDLDTSSNVYVEFNIGEKLKGSFEQQAASIQTLTGGPVLTRDEGRALLNRNALGGAAAELITPLNVIVGGQASPTDSGSQNVAGAVAQAFEKRKRAVAPPDDSDE